MGILSAFTGVILVLCLIGSRKAAELNNCDSIESCIKYSESMCNAAGQRTVCISWAPIAGCPLNVAADAVDCVCGQDMIGQITKTPCEALPDSPTNGELTDPPEAPVPSGTVINAMCNEGYELAEGTAMFTTCKSDGSYTPYPTSCIGVDCGVPEEGTSNEPVVITDTRHPATYTYLCVTDHATSDPVEAMCLANGEWSIDPPTCAEAIDCGVPDEGTSTEPVVITDTRHPATYTYLCVTDHATSDPVEAMCLGNGEWSIAPPTCTEEDED